MPPGTSSANPSGRRSCSAAPSWSSARCFPGSTWRRPTGVGSSSTALNDPADGAIIAAGGAVLVLLGRSGSFVDSRILTVAAAPVVIALACALLAVVAYRSAGDHLDVLRRSGAVGGLSVGLDLTVLGAVIATGGGAVRLWRARRLFSRPSLVARDIAQLILGIAGALGGFWLGLVGTLSVLGPNMGALLFAAIFGGFAGGHLGVVLGGLIIRPATRP